MRRSFRFSPSTALAALYLGTLMLGLIASLAITVVFPMAAAAAVIIVTILGVGFVAGWLMSKRSPYGYALWIAGMLLLSRICWQLGRGRTLSARSIGPDGESTLSTFHKAGSTHLRLLAYVHVALALVALVEGLVLLIVRIRQRKRALTSPDTK